MARARLICIRLASSVPFAGEEKQDVRRKIGSHAGSLEVTGRCDERNGEQPRPSVCLYRNERSWRPAGAHFGCVAGLCYCDIARSAA